MKSLVCICLAGLFICGCQGPDPTPPAATVAEAEPVRVLEQPATTSQGNLGLWKNDESVRVGSGVDEAFKVFRGDRPGGFQNDRLPKGLGPAFGARVWTGAELSFGVITYKDNVAAAMYQMENVDQSDLNNIVAAYQKHIGSELLPEMISGDRVNYWFWTDKFTKNGLDAGEQRLMIMAYHGTQNAKVFVTVAMGDGAVLDVLGANPQAARSDATQVDQILSRRDASNNAGTNR